MYRSTVRMVFCAFYVAAFVIIGVEVAELRARLETVNAKTDSVLAKVLRSEDEVIAVCEEFAAKMYNEILVKRYCLRDNVTITGAKEDKR